MTSSNRLWILLTVVLGIGILALGWFLGISPKLDEASATDASKSTVDALNQQKSLEVQRLKTDSTKLPAIRQELSQLLEQLPSNAAYPTFLTELNQIAGANHIDVTNVTFAVPTTLTGATTSAAVTSPTPSASSTATAAPPAPVTNVVPPGSTVAIPTTMTLTGTFNSLQSATGDLQTGKRLFLVSGLQFAKIDASASDSSAAYTVNVTGTMYVLTDGSTLISSTAASSPVPTPTVAP